MQKIRLGTIHADYLTMAQAIESIVSMAERKEGGYVVTPNVDHVVLAEKDDGIRAAYAEAALSLVDGMPLVWASRLAGYPLPEKISGSDLVRPLLARSAEKGLRIYLLGAAPGVGARAAERLEGEIPGLNVVGVDSPALGFETDPAAEAETRRRMDEADPDIVLVALGCPKQELLMRRWRSAGARAVMLGIGASLDFIAGEVRRAPAWMSAIGLEWLYRLAQDPKRLARRYLVQDAAILGVVVRMLRTPKPARVFNA